VRCRIDRQDAAPTREVEVVVGTDAAGGTHLAGRRMPPRSAARPAEGGNQFRDVCRCDDPDLVGIDPVIVVGEHDP
jgi:hypothetical protein